MEKNTTKERNEKEHNTEKEILKQENMTLNRLKPGERAVLLNVGGEGALRQHFLDMGLIPGVEVKLVKLAPMGDPMELQVHGYELTLRLADAENITISKLESEDKAEKGIEDRKKKADTKKDRASRSW